MSRLQILLIAGVVVVLLFAGAAVGAWYYLFGAPERSAAELVPANTIAFVTIPNGTLLVEAFQSSQVKTLLTSPNMKPLHDAIVSGLGQKNIDLLNIFVPNLSGQSFIAVTHFDADHPESIGLIAAMKPKAGFGDFGAFLDKIKETYPDLIKQGTTGKGNVEGYDYDWIKGPGAPDKICVAHIKGWIVTTWGEASLQDWIQRFEKRSTTSSLADDVDYRKTISRVGDNPMTLAYVNYRVIMEALSKQIAKTNPAMGDYLSKKLNDLGGAAVGSSFENGQIVDRYTFIMPRPAQLEAGMGTDPCAFDTLKFTGRDTRMYWAASMNWKQSYENLKEQEQADPSGQAAARTVGLLEDWAVGAGLDVKHNIIEALGSEISLQADWNEQNSFPEVGLFLKVDKPDDFRPVVNAVIDSVRKAYANSAVIKEFTLNDQKFDTLNFVPSGALSPTITENNEYLGVFLTGNQAARSFQRDATLNLTHNDNFNQQIGDKLKGAQQVLYLDSPYMLDRTYKTVLPYLSMASMFNKDVANALQGHQLPEDLSWLAPIGTWSYVVTTDESGVQAYSVSGIGNQGMFLFGLSAGALGAAEGFGFLPQTSPIPLPFAPVAPTMGTKPGDAAPTSPVPTAVIAPAPVLPATPAPTPSPVVAPLPSRAPPPAPTPAPSTSSGVPASTNSPDATPSSSPPGQ